MSSTDMWDWITKGGAIGVMATVLWFFITGRIVARWAHDEALERAQAELADALQREARLWDLLKRTSGWADKAATVAERATNVADQAAAAVVRTRWADTEARARRRRTTDPDPDP